VVGHASVEAVSHTSRGTGVLVRESIWVGKDAEGCRMGVGSTRRLSRRDRCPNERKSKEQDSDWSTRIWTAAGAIGKCKRSARPMDLSIKQPSNQEREEKGGGGERGREITKTAFMRALWYTANWGKMRLQSISSLLPIDIARGARFPRPSPPLFPPLGGLRPYASPLQGVPIIAHNCHSCDGQRFTSCRTAIRVEPNCNRPSVMVSRLFLPSLNRSPRPALSLQPRAALSAPGLHGTVSHRRYSSKCRQRCPRPGHPTSKMTPY
jgi:hypothetical protein